MRERKRECTRAREKGRGGAHTRERKAERGVWGVVEERRESGTARARAKERERAGTREREKCGE